LFATATWVCRSGSPARLSRWVNAVATRPRTLTCRIAQVRHHPAGQDYQRGGSKLGSGDAGRRPLPVHHPQAVFALRQCLDAAIADNRLAINPAISVPLPSEPLKPPRFLSQSQVEQLVDAMPDKYKAMVLVGAYAGLRWGEAAGLTRASIDVLRSRITVASTAVEVRGRVTLGHEPKTSRSKRTVPVARSVIRRLEEHLVSFVGPEPDALVFTAPRGGPLARSLFSRRVWRPAIIRAGIPSITFHGLRHSFVAILVAAGCNVREVRSGPATTASHSR
jgi:integrase